MNEYHEKPGLHIVTLYAQVHELAEVEELVTKHKIKYPIAMNGFWEVGYTAPGLPKVWIVGTDGKIKFAGFAGYSKTLKEELDKVKYPGLGKASVVPALQPAAELFAKGQYGAAFKAAEKVYDETEVAAEEDDADWIIKRIEQRAEALQMRAETAEVEKRFDIAMRCWEALTKYAGVSEAEGAAKRLAKLNESEDVKKEIAARRALLAEMLSLNVYYTTIDATNDGELKTFREKCLESYKKFVAAHKGTGAAARAQELIEIFTELLAPPAEEKPAEDKPAEPPKKE